MQRWVKHIKRSGFVCIVVILLLFNWCCGQQGGFLNPYQRNRCIDTEPSPPPGFRNPYPNLPMCTKINPVSQGACHTYSCIFPMSKPGYCPPPSYGITPSQTGECMVECVMDYTCPNQLKCCANGCGFTCIPPVTPPACPTASSSGFQTSGNINPNQNTNINPNQFSSPNPSPNQYAYPNYYVDPNAQNPNFQNTNNPGNQGFMFQNTNNNQQQPFVQQQPTGGQPPFFGPG